MKVRPRKLRVLQGAAMVGVGGLMLGCGGGTREPPVCGNK
jgi:hypothetical protein